MPGLVSTVAFGRYNASLYVAGLRLSKHCVLLCPNCFDGVICVSHLRRNIK